VADDGHLGALAKIVCLGPVDDPELRAAALAWAAKALEAGREREVDPAGRLTMGMALYRAGEHAAAIAEMENAAALAMRRGEPLRSRIVRTAAFYRAMSSFRQGDPAGAHALFAATEARVDPEPEGQREPAGIAHLDEIVLWLSYREAKELLAAPLPPAPSPAGADAPGAGPRAPKDRGREK